MTESLIYDILIILAAGLIAAVLCRWLRASVLIGYLLAGALLGQGILGLVADREHQLEYFAEVGVFLLLFSIGLEFSLDDLRRLGSKLVIGGGVQMGLVAFPVMAILHGLGFQWRPAVLIASALSFSSTVLVFKSLSEWGQSDKPHGRRAIGILLFQDAALVPLLLIIPLLTGEGETVTVYDYLILALVSILFVVSVVALRHLLSTRMIPLFSRYRSPELIILFTLVALGWLTLAAYRLGLPPAVGAFAAGLIFNGNRWTEQIDALVLPFRETFAAIFFIGLGLIFDPRLILNEPLWMLMALVSVIVIKAIAALVALRLTGLSWQSAFGMGIGLAHVGEFAFVLVLLGVDSGVLSRDDYQRVVAIAIGSLVLTPPLIKAGMGWVDNADRDEETKIPIRHPDQDGEHQGLVIGAGPIGRQVASQLEINGIDVCVIDLSPMNLHTFAQEGFRTVTGDACHHSTLRLAGIEGCGLTVVCVPHDESALHVVQAVKELNPKCRLLVRCRYLANSSKLRAAGADHVVSEEAEASIALLRLLDTAPR